jgi:hypothetical protein
MKYLMMFGTLDVSVFFTDIHYGRSQALPSMRLASNWDNAQELQSIEVKIVYNGNITFFSQSPQLY